MAGLGAILCLPVAASAAQAGDWTVGTGQGYVEYTVRNGPDATFVIACDEGATENGAHSNVGAEIAGKPPADGTSFEVDLDGKSYRFAQSEQLGNLRSRASRADFAAMWERMRSAREMRVTFADGRSSPFSLRGVRQALDPKPCRTGD
ncbi:MAG: hypothetical protein PGN34_13610 [Methylobacterium frigidaeris]